jgi:hypothetical protein
LKFDAQEQFGATIRKIAVHKEIFAERQHRATIRETCSE